MQLWSHLHHHQSLHDFDELTVLIVEAEEGGQPGLICQQAERTVGLAIIGNKAALERMKLVPSQLEVTPHPLQSSALSRCMSSDCF